MAGAAHLTVRRPHPSAGFDRVDRRARARFRRRAGQSDGLYHHSRFHCPAGRGCLDRPVEQALDPFYLRHHPRLSRPDDSCRFHQMAFDGADLHHRFSGVLFQPVLYPGEDVDHPRSGERGTFAHGEFSGHDDGDDRFCRRLRPGRISHRTLRREERFHHRRGYVLYLGVLFAIDEDAVEVEDRQKKDHEGRETDRRHRQEIHVHRA